MIRLALIRVLGRPLILRHTPRGNGADAIVILGCALRADGSLSGPLEERVRAGAEAYRSGLAPVVCATGGVPLGASVDRPEAHAMRTRLVELELQASFALYGLQRAVGGPATCDEIAVK